jgi:hypothetical protein
MRVVEHDYALAAIEVILGSAGGFLELAAQWPSGEAGSAWLAPRARDLARYVLMQEDQGANQELFLARPKRLWGSPTRFPVLWCRIVDRPGAQRLRETAFARSVLPVPTVVLREGGSSRYVALWALRRPLTAWDDVVRWNERLSFALSGRRRFANPDHFSLVPPGAVIREDGKRPCPVMATRVGLEDYDVEEVVGGLRDAPDLDALRERGFQPVAR